MSKYPSDISREQFERIRPILESCRKKTSPRRIDLYDVFCGVLYLLKSGCQWRMLPKDYPKWRNATIILVVGVRLVKMEKIMFFWRH